MEVPTKNFRPTLANYPPSEWGCSFASLSPEDEKFESCSNDVEVLKKKVKDLLMQSTGELTKNVEFINLLCRLGVSYHFKSEINEQLDNVFTISIPNILEHSDYDLYTLAILFRVLRQHGHKVSCDLFNKFKDTNGEFKESIAHDVKGLLSLYEASFLSVHGEEILDEALAFTRQHLETLAEKSSPHLAKHIRNALFRPFHHGANRTETLRYISFYEEDESRNETLLKFAKLDFNLLQLLYRKELSSLSRWWKDINLMEKLPYIRDKIVEVYVWAVGMAFEPHFVHARLRISKHLCFITVLDDTYDAYGTFDELKYFTAALQRFTIDAVDELPEYMKFLCKSLMKYTEETEYNGTQICSYKTSFDIEMWKELARSYFVEAKWLNDGYLPTFNEYMSNGFISSTSDLLAAAFILGVGEEDSGMKEMIWLRDNPKISQTAKSIGRWWNDLSAREDEQKKVSTVVCYMNEYGVSKQKSEEEILKLIEDGWKYINEDFMKPTMVQKILPKILVNYARMADFTYNGGIDSYTNGSYMKEDITSLFIQPLPI